MNRRNFLGAAAVAAAASNRLTMKPLNVQSIGQRQGGRLVSLNPLPQAAGSSLRIDVPSSFAFELLSIYADVVPNAANPTRRPLVNASYKTITMWEVAGFNQFAAGAVTQASFIQGMPYWAIVAGFGTTCLPKNLLPPESVLLVSLIGNAGNDAWTSAVCWGLAYPL